MGNCKYCEKPAGFLRSKHNDCEDQHQQGLQRVSSEVIRAINGNDHFDGLEKAISDIARSSFISQEDRLGLLIKGWENAVDQFLTDGILDEAEEKRLLDFKDHFSLNSIDLDRNGALTKTAKAAVLRDIFSGKLPPEMDVKSRLPINFQKGEQVVWVFQNSKYLEDKVRRQFVGGSQGVSVRVMKGVYYRVGAFKGQAVEHTERVHLDSGLVVITDKNIYFAGSSKSTRIPYSKIISFEPYSDGIGIMRDAATAKPQIFVTGDGGFAYNLVTNLSQL